MDTTSETSTFSHENNESSPMSPFQSGQQHSSNESPEILDNTEYYNSDSTSTLSASRNFSVTLNANNDATNSHPLMNSCASPMSADYPDLIPEKAKGKHSCERQLFRPQADSTRIESPHSVDYSPSDGQTIETNEYKEHLPDFPKSPSALKKILTYDWPMEVSPQHGDLSDTENDKSVYEAHLSSNLQNVSLTMNEKEGNLNFLAHKKKSNKLRRIKIMPPDEQSEEESDMSSLDSISESLKSEDVFKGSLTLADQEDPEPEDASSSEPIEPLSAADERKHARYWQRMVLPGGEQRTIDMRVIEPYKRVLSHGGYVRAGGHTAIVIFSACYLPDRSRVDYDYVMDNLFLYILWTLERLVTDDYVMVYLHGGATKLPAFSWLKRCYHMVGRKLRKNLSHLYLVHPTLWIKTMLFMAKPFISSKFYRKITYVASLRELMVRVPLEAAAIPDKVKAYDSLHCVPT